MIRFLSFSLFTLLSIYTFGQNSYPACDDLIIEAIQIDSSGNLIITNRNTCYDCRYGLDGCLYSEMLVIRSVFPFDTIAASECYCLFWDDPNLKGELQDFSLNMQTSSLPPVSELQVRMIGCGCDIIPFSQSLSDNTTSVQSDSFIIFPQPASDKVFISNTLPGSQMRITDLNGKIKYLSIVQEQTEISTSDFTNGVYIISIQNKGIVNHQLLFISK